MHKHSDKKETPSVYNLSHFIPLIVVLSIVCLLTVGTLVLSEGTYIDGMRFFMGYFFLAFGGFKVIKLKGFAEAYGTYDLIAMRSSGYAYAYPFIELLLAFLFLTGNYLIAANVITLTIMLVGALGVYKKLLQKEEIPCACLGVVFKIPMTYVTLFEDLLMAGMAAGMLLLM